MLMRIDYPEQKTLQEKVKDEIGKIHDKMAAEATKSFQDIVTGIKSIKELRGALTEVEKYRNDCWHDYRNTVLSACPENGETEFLNSIVLRTQKQKRQ